MAPAASADPGPTHVEVVRLQGPVLLEFGDPACGHCAAAQPLIAAALAGREGVRHIKVADGRGKRLGRAFAVKLWPTLVFLKDGREVARAVRPGDAGEIARGLERIAPASS